MPENFIQSLKEKMDGENEPELEWVEPTAKEWISSDLIYYADAVQEFRKSLLHDGCPLCGSRVETRKTKFHFVVWDLWICTGGNENKCPMSEAFNDIFQSYGRFKEDTDGDSS